MNTEKAIQKTTEQAHAAVDHASKNVTALVERASHTKEQAVDAGTDLAQRLGHATEEAVESIAKARDKAISYYEASNEATCAYVAKKPITSVLIAAGVGAGIAALLMSRRGSR